MNRMTVLEDFFKGSFNVLNGLPEYVTIEEMAKISAEEDWEGKFQKFIAFGEEQKVKRLCILINKATDHYQTFSELLRMLGFEAYASRIEVYRDLADLSSDQAGFEWCSVGDSNVSEEEFKSLWSRCMLGSENRQSTLTIEEHMASVKSELGEGWENACRAIYQDGRPLGISIPHIEPGTVNEGRLFYFGLVPEARGKGLSVVVHRQSLFLLKQLGAEYYIGSTHETNQRMQRVFLRNGCTEKGRNESYYTYF